MADPQELIEVGKGNVTAMVASNQVLSAANRYQPFGTTITSSGTMASANLMRFSSKLFHTYTDLYYYGYRFYHPNLQRWMNSDPIWESGFEAVKGSNYSIDRFLGMRANLPASPANSELNIRVRFITS